MGGAAATLLSRRPLPPSPRPVAVEVGSPVLTAQLQRRCSSSARTPHYLHRLTLAYDLLVLCLDPAASSLAPWVPLPPPEFIPGRVHVARAIVGAGYVDNLKQAFSRYLYDGGPAYATGSEPDGESVVQLICRTGGIAVLAHPWALKNPVPVIKDLKGPGLHAIEVYRSDGKLSGLSDLAYAYELLKLGGSDYHGRDDKEEPDIGSFDLPVLAFSRFLENWRKQMILRLRFSRRNLQTLSSVTEAARRLLNNGQKSPPISTDTVWFV